MNVRIVLRLLGMAIVGLGIAQTTALPWGLLHDGPEVTSRVLGAAATTLGAGLALTFLGQGGAIRRVEALVVVAGLWVAAGIFGGLPYLTTGVIEQPVSAFFESISGFSTTGATVLTSIEGTPHAVLWWRSMTQWLGGMGIIVLFLAVFPTLGVGSRHLFRFEVPGPITESLKPKIRHTAIALWSIYAFITGLEVVLLMIAGMDLFEATNHAFTTMATGGFSTRDASVAGFDSPAIEWIITVFMVLAGINFGLYHVAREGRWRQALRSEELWVYLGILLVGCAIISSILHLDEGIAATIRHVCFTVASLATTTGFVTSDFDFWPNLARALLLILMVMGGMAGSTAGGMKISRVIILMKSGWQEVHRVFRPQAVLTTRLDGRKVDDGVVRGVLAFFVLATLMTILGVLVLAAFDGGGGSADDRLVTHVTAVLACLFNVGPGLASVGGVENYAFLAEPVKLLLSFLMILGRLEFYAVLVLLLPAFWRR